MENNHSLESLTLNPTKTTLGLSQVKPNRDPISIRVSEDTRNSKVKIGSSDFKGWKIIRINDMGPDSDLKIYWDSVERPAIRVDKDEVYFGPSFFAKRVQQRKFPNLVMGKTHISQEGDIYYNSKKVGKITNYKMLEPTASLQIQPPKFP